MLNVSKKLLGAVIISSCIIAFIFNPYIGIIQVPTNVLNDLSFAFRIIFQLVISLYILSQFVLPFLSKALKGVFK